MARHNRVLRNAIANYAGAGVLVVVPILTLPTYLSRLGDLQWGLLGFVATLQSLLAVLDAGMSQVLIREFAIRLDGPPGEARTSAGRLLANCERFYLFLGLGVAAILLALAHPISLYWLNVSSDLQHLGRLAVMGAAGLCALQLMGVLYRGVLIAAQNQASLNLVLGTGAIVRYGGGVLVVLASPTIQAYLTWHLMSLALEIFVRHRLAWQAVGGRNFEAGGSRDELRLVLTGMGIWTFAAMLGAISAQMDKSILTAMRPIGDLASYFVASQVAAGAVQLFYPVITAMLPLMLQPAVRAADSFRTNLKMAAILLLVCGALTLFMLVYGRDGLTWWLGEQRAVQVQPLLCVLLLGVGFNALTNIGYINWLALGKRVHLLVANGTALGVVCVSTPLLVAQYGVMGAAVAWALGQLTTLLISLGWVSNAFRRN